MKGLPQPLLQPHRQRHESRDRRFKYFQINAESFFDACATVFGNWHHKDTIWLPRIEGLPEGYSIEGMFADQMDDRINFRVYHPEFEPTSPDGSIPKYAAPQLEWIELRGMKEAGNDKPRAGDRIHIRQEIGRDGEGGLECRLVIGSSSSSTAFTLGLIKPHGDHCVGSLKNFFPDADIDADKIHLAEGVTEDDAIKAFGDDYSHRFRWREDAPKMEGT